MADVPRPFDAYRGDGDYVFVSYAHADAATVYPDLILLKDDGFNVWYDEGIRPGSRWTSELADAIEGCALFITFLSPTAAASENCINEIEFAVSRRRPILVVHTEETTLAPGLELSLGSRQALMRYRLPQDAYRTRLLEGARSLMTGGDPNIPPPPKAASPARPLLLSGLVVLAALALYLATKMQTPTEHSLPLAIAVRPFDTTATDPDNRLFAEGIADDLVMRLGHWRTLPVIARGSSFAANLPADPIEAGNTLKARYLVDGTVASRGDTVRLSVYLIDATNGQNVWSREYEHAVDEIIDVQSEIADTIVTEINPALISAETQRAVRADPANLDAWSAAMRGWWHLNTETREGLEEAQQWFRRAAELDPAWSWPHSALALSAYRAYTNNWADDPAQNNRLLIESASTAVRLDAQDAFAHHALGHAYAAQGQIQQSLDALARGVELSPNDPMANGCYAMQLAASAEAMEALRVIDHAMTLSPADPWQHRFALVKARAYFASALYGESEIWALRSQQLKPSMGALLHAVAAPALGGGLERAMQRTEEARSTRSLPPLAGIEMGFRRSTDPGYVDRLLEGLRRAGFE